MHELVLVEGPISGVDLDGMITQWIEKAAEISGFTLRRTKGKNLVQNFIQPDYRKSVGHVLQTALDGKRQLTWRLSESKHGETFTVLLNAATRRDAEGGITGVVGGGQDITEPNQVLAESKRVQMT